MWPEESTSRGTSLVSNNPKYCRASMGGSTMSHASKSGVLGIFIVEKNEKSVKRKEKKEKRGFGG